MCGQTEYKYLYDGTPSGVNGNHHLYQFEKLGDDDAEPEFTTSFYPNNCIASSSLPRCFFRTHPLDNLVLVDEMTSFCPIVDARIVNLFATSAGNPRDVTQQYAANIPGLGRGARSTFRMLQHVLDNEASVSLERCTQG
ncbi:unnamed protein product [Rhizoctonia solani]|nr:unnamed protein product [Rhizoctonia solani]